MSENVLENIIKKNEFLDIRKFLRKLIDIHYTRNDKVLERGNVRYRGDLIEIFPAYEDSCIRIDLFGNQVEEIVIFNNLTGEIREKLKPILNQFSVYEPLPFFVESGH